MFTSLEFAAREIDRFRTGELRLQTLLHFEETLYRDLQENPSLEDYIMGDGEIDGRLDIVQAEIRSLLRWLPLIEQNAKLCQDQILAEMEVRRQIEATRIRNLTQDTVKIRVVPTEVQLWIKATSQVEPETA